MLVSVLPVPFADAGRQRQYDTVLAALMADANAPATVLLGNMGAFSPLQVDMLVVRPTGLALGLLLPQSGQLTIPALASGPWLLDGQALPGQAGSDNPFGQYQQQLPVALAWLSEQLGLPKDELPPCAGFALFEAPLTFGLEVEAQLHRAPHDFQLVGEATQLPARLRQQWAAAPATLDADELLEWGEYLANEPDAPHNKDMAESLFESPANFLEQKLRQLWRWLGAADIPADPPYGGLPPDQHLRDQQEQARLQQLRQELQAELHQQRQEAAAREAARTQELAQLREQLAQAGPSATERQAEQRAKEALEASLRTARAELATRNTELDARIQQLGQLIGQLQAGPSTPASSRLPAGNRLPDAVATAPKLRPAAAPRRSFRRLRQAERWGLVALVAAGLGAGTWGIVRWTHRPARQPVATAAKNNQDERNAAEYTPDEPSDSVDSLSRMHVASIDTITTPPAQAEQTATEATEAVVQPTTLQVDSAGLTTKPTPLLPGAEADSTATQPSPTP